MSDRTAARSLIWSACISPMLHLLLDVIAVDLFPAGSINCIPRGGGMIPKSIPSTDQTSCFSVTAVKLYLYIFQHCRALLQELPNHSLNAKLCLDHRISDRCSGKSPQVIWDYQLFDRAVALHPIFLADRTPVDQHPIITPRRITFDLSISNRARTGRSI
jgi:hypothetical protein